MLALLVLPTMGHRVAEALAALAAIRETATIPHEVLVIADRVTAEQGAALGSVSHWIDTRPERRGLVGAYNAGLAFFHGNDRFTHLWQMEDGATAQAGLDVGLARALVAHPRFGWVGASQVENPRAPFTAMCSMLTREAAAALGYYDLAFAPYHFEDADAVMRLRQVGFMPHGVTAKVSHPAGMTSMPEVERSFSQTLLEAHRWLFQQRWGMPDMAWDMMPVHDPFTCRACVEVA